MSCSKKVNEKILRSSYTAEFKCRVILFAEKHSNCAASRKYGVNEKSVRDWRGQRNALATCPSDRMSFRGPKKGRFPKLEDEVTDFILKLRNDGHRVSYDMIHTKARDVARKQGIPLDKFSASRGWAKKLMLRQGFSLRARSQFKPKLPADFPDKLLAFQREINNFRRVKDYLVCQIGSADHTPILLHFPSNYNVVRRNGVNEVSLINSRHGGKQRFTVMLSCTADGCKLPPYVIFKGKVISHKLVFPRRVVVRADLKGSMNNNLMVDWLKCVWLRRPGTHLSDDSLIVLDKFRGHLTSTVQNILKENGTDVVTVPRKTASKLLPLESMLHKRFKVGLQKRYMEWLCQTDVKQLKRIKRIPITLLAEWILAMWDAIPREKLEELFKKCFILNSLEGTEEDTSKVVVNCEADVLKDASLPQDKVILHKMESLSEDEVIVNNEQPSSTGSDTDSNSEGSYLERSSSDNDGSDC